MKMMMMIIMIAASSVQLTSNATVIPLSYVDLSLCYYTVYASS